MPVFARSITLWPAQNVNGPFGVMVATGNGFTDIGIAPEVTEHPLELVTITVYNPGSVAEKLAWLAPGTAAAPRIH